MQWEVALRPRLGKARLGMHVLLSPHKIWFAAIAVALALTGVISGLKWLTVLALVVWIVAMMVFGTGKRKGSNNLK